jgi:hypothetical protein
MNQLAPALITSESLLDSAAGSLVSEQSSLNSKEHVMEQAPDSMLEDGDIVLDQIHELRLAECQSEAYSDDAQKDIKLKCRSILILRDETSSHVYTVPANHRIGFDVHLWNGINCTKARRYTQLNFGRNVLVDTDETVSLCVTVPVLVAECCTFLIKHSMFMCQTLRRSDHDLE